MNKSEEQTIRNVIDALRCKPRPDGSAGEAEEVREALRGPARLYLETWVIGALECLLPEQRDLKLALAMSKP